MPHYYVKTKGIEKKIFNEHKKYEGKNELDAKVEYVKEARALPTYGVSFFLVKVSGRVDAVEYAVVGAGGGG